MRASIKTHRGGCHCGAVRFEVRAPEMLEVVECNCSICRKSGYLHLIVGAEDFRLLSGEDALSEYRFNTKTARHFFCSNCGVKSFYVPRSHPDGFSVNARCLNDDTVKGMTIKAFDGQNWEKAIDHLPSFDASAQPKQPAMYEEIAEWFHLLTLPADYAEESALYVKLFNTHSDGCVSQVLELGSGGGCNASHMSAHLELTLVDRSPKMLAISQTLNPSCEHLVGDMRTVRLNRQFDAVFVHDAVMYLTTADDIAAMIETAALHCRPGGLLLLAPDWTRESFRQSTEHGGHDGNGRAMRYLQWDWDPEPNDSTFRCDFAYLLRRGKTVACVHDIHEMGLFTIDQWRGAMEAGGFEWIDTPKHPELLTLLGRRRG